MRITAIEYILQNPDYFRNNGILSDYWQRVNGQAINHTRRNDDNILSLRSRPNENAIVKEYRQANKRYMSSEGVDNWLTKFNRTVGGSGVTISKQSLSVALSEWIEDRSYTYLNTQTQWREYFFNCVLPIAIDDPNAVIVDFPYNPNDPDIAPAESPDIARQRIGIKTIIIPSSDIIETPDGIFSWRGGVMPIEGKQNATAPFFWIIDVDFFYQYVPVWRNSKLIYELREWYLHDAGIGEDKILPIAPLPGKITPTVEDIDLKYKESFLRAYFEYADEFEVRFQDNQAVWVRTAYPKAIIKPIPCSNNECRNGDIIIYNDQGEKVDIQKCDTCGGKGVISDISPFDTLIRQEGGGFEKEANTPLLEYVSPDTSILQTNFDIPFDLLKRGMNAIGLNVTGTEAESGEAKKVRLQVLEDILSAVSFSLFKGTLQQHLENIESLLNRDRSKRRRPVVVLPESYKIKDIDTLTEEAALAVQSDKMLSEMRLIERKYNGDPSIIRAYELAYAWSPMLTMTREEIEFRFVGGVGYDARDIYKRDHAVSIFIELSKVPDFLDWDMARAFSEANKILDAIAPVTVPLFEGEEGEAIEAGDKNPLLETVGGVQGIIQVSQAVADGKMSEKAAEKLLMEIFGFTQAVAQSLIDIPTVPPPQQNNANEINKNTPN